MQKEYNFWVYILTNYKRNALYIGVTNNLARRLQEHYDNRGKPETFAGKYYCYNLVYYEWHKYVNNAIGIEKTIKEMRRSEKDALIIGFNPEWRFFNKEVCGEWPPTFEGRLEEGEPL